MQGSPTVASPLLTTGGPAAGGGGSQRGVAAWMAAIVGGSSDSDQSTGSNGTSMSKSAGSVGRRGSAGSSDVPLIEGGASTIAGDGNGPKNAMTSPILRSQSTPNMAEPSSAREMAPPPPRVLGAAATNTAYAGSPGSGTPAQHASVPVPAGGGGVVGGAGISDGAETPMLLAPRASNERVTAAASGLQALADGFAEEHASSGGPTRRLTTRLQTQAADQRWRKEAEGARPSSSERKAIGAQPDDRNSNSGSDDKDVSDGTNGSGSNGVDAAVLRAAEETTIAEVDAPLRLGLDPSAPSLRILGHSRSIKDGSVQFEVRFESAGEEPEDFWCDRAELAESPHAAALKSYEAEHGLLGGVLV